MSKPSSFQLFARLWKGYLIQHKWWIALAMVFMAIEGSTVGFLSYALQPMFDMIFVDGNSGAILLIGGAILGLFIAKAVAGVLHRVIMTRVASLAGANLQVDLLDHIVNLDMSFHSTTSPGVLIERVQGDVLAVQMHWRTIVIGGARDLIALISLLGVTLTIDWRWTAVAIVGAPLLIFPSLVLQRYIRRKSVSLRNLAGQRTTRLDEVFHSLVAVKLNQMEDYQVQQFAGLSDRIVKADVKTQAGNAGVPGLVDLAIGLGFFCVLLYGSPEVIRGEKSIGQFMSFFTALALLFQPLRRLAAVTGAWQMMQASLERIYELFGIEPTVVDPKTNSSATIASPEIVFENVSLSYDGSNDVIKNLSFTIPQGRNVALVGPSGAGKSSVLNLITRLVDPTLGRITIGGTDLKDIPLEDLRQQFSVVSQDALLFDETLRENILLDQKGVSEKHLMKIIEDANIAEFLAKLPDGLETKVGARGSNLSGGQRQRVAIARALLRDAPILLLDEATSAMDAKTEKLVQSAIDRLSVGRTTFTVTHRLSTIRHADDVIVMENGALIETGNHDSLVAQDGVYAKLIALQAENS